MNATPPTVVFGKIDVENLANTLAKFNHYKVSNEIEICNYSSSEHFQACLNTNICSLTDLNLIIQIHNCQPLITTDSQPDESVNTLLILNGINKVLGEDIGDALALLLESDHTIYAKLSEIVNTHLNAFANKDKQEFFQVLSLRIWVYQLVYDIVDEIRYRLYPNNLIKYKQDDVKKIKELANKLKENFQISSPSLDEMAELVEMSPTKFKNIFKDVLDESPHQFILDLRLNRAKVLLKNQDLTISQISYKVGFNHPSALTRLFKNKLGVSPNEIFKR
jgi:AraC-like DNA-binding protein